MPQFAKNTIVMLVSALVAVLLLEGALRVASALLFPRMMIIDPVLGWRHAAGREKSYANELGQSVLVRQNSHGHRGPEPAAMKPAGGRRLLVLGDSFVEAVQVLEEQTFTSLLAAALPGVEVLNAGVGGWGTVQEYVYLQAEGVALAPDVVLVMVYDNDLVDNCLSYSPGFGPRPYAYVDQLSNTVRLETRLDPAPFGRFALRMPFWYELNQHSYLYNLVNSRVYQRLAGKRLNELAREEREQQGRFCGTQVVLVDVLERMRALLAARGADLNVAVIPAAVQLERDEEGADAAVLAYCESHGLGCVSLLPPLRAAAISGAETYFQRDIHWTAEGHRIAARELAALLGGFATASGEASDGSAN